MKRLAALVLLLVWVSAGCSGGEGEIERWLDGTSWASPAVLLIRQGTPCTLTQAEGEAELTAREEVLLPRTDGEAGEVTFRQVERGYAPELALRVTPLFEEETLLGMDAAAQVTVEKAILEPAGLSSGEREKIFTAIEKQLALQEQGQSALTRNGNFLPEEEAPYAALTFVPCVYHITGTLKQGEDPVQFEAVYPCVNPAGYLDGLYIAATADDPDALGDVA